MAKNVKEKNAKKSWIEKEKQNPTVFLSRRRQNKSGENSQIF